MKVRERSRKESVMGQGKEERQKGSDGSKVAKGKDRWWCVSSSLLIKLKTCIANTIYVVTNSRFQVRGSKGEHCLFKDGDGCGVEKLNIFSFVGFPGVAGPP